MKKMFVYVGLLTAFVLSSCSKDENQLGSTESSALNVAVSVDSKVSTRSLVTGSAFTSGKSIGVFITGTGYTSAKSVFTFDGSGWATASSILLSGNDATVYSFYPSTLDADMENMTIPVSVASTLSTSDGKAFSAANNAQEDYLYAVDATTTSAQSVVNKTTNSASLKLKHALAAISFVIKKSATFGGAGSLTNITLTKSTGTFNTGTGTLSLVDGTLGTLNDLKASLSYSDATGISINGVGVNTPTATALVPVSQLSSDGTITGSSIVTLYMTIDGFVYHVALPVATVAAWAAGNNYTYTITVAGGTLSITSVSITDWVATDGGSATIE